MFAAVVLSGGSVPQNVILPPPVASPYRLAPGDRLRIIVFGELTLSGEYGLTPAGNVAFPLVGSVHAAGGSVEELQEAIRVRLADGYLNDPRVSAEVIAYRPFYILGEVTRPGAFPFAVGMTVDQAVAAAGGYTYRANHRRAFIRHAGVDKEDTVDLRRGPVIIGPGDTVRIGERYF